MTWKRYLSIFLMLTMLLVTFAGVPAFAEESNSGGADNGTLETAPDISVKPDATSPDLTAKERHTLTATVAAAVYEAVDQHIESDSFTEDFNDNNADGWSTYGGDWSASTGAYIVNAGGGFKAVANGTDFDNFAYEADVTISGGANNDNAGLIFRVSDPTVGADNLKGYYAGIRNGGTVQVGRFNNGWKELANVPYPINSNTQYRLKVEAKGRNIEVYVDGVHVVSVADDMWTHGAIGVRTWWVNAKYDNLAAHKIIPVTGIQLDKHTLTMDAIGTDTLIATVSPANATNKKIHFTSDSPNVTLTSEAYNEENGTALVKINANNPGSAVMTAVITAAAEDNSSITDTCTVTVDVPADPDTAYKAQLTLATAAVEKAEVSKLQADVDSARTLVNVLRDADKASLGARLDIVQSYIDSQPVYHGLKGDYYKSSSTSSHDFATLVSTRADETINFYDNFTQILKDRTGQTEACAIRWTGKIQPKFDEDYTFYLIGDNGFRLWVDNKLIIDHWVNDWEVPQTSSQIALKAGSKYNFKLEYFQATGGADIRLEWSSLSQPRRVVPVECFYQPDGRAIPIITSSVEPVTGTCQVNSYPKLPATVTVNYSDGTKKEQSVTWNFNDPTLFAQVGTATVTGNVAGTTAQAIAIVTVTPYTKWEKQQAPLMTKWADEVTPDNALPEYPRMQMQRSEWQNLNGLWQFEPGTATDEVPVGKEMARQILVPYPMESALSGVMTHYDRAWYRKTFTIPENWNGEKIKLNFGAVDWESEVFINGKSVGIHKGGYDPFSYDITPYLNSTGLQELIVRVYDPTDAAGNPRGKQTLYPGGIMYTATTGIWQTVWLEPVASDCSIDNLKIEPDVDGGRLKLTVNTAGSADGVTVTATAKDGPTVVGTVSGEPNVPLYIPIPDAKLWSPENPFLYGLKVDLKKDSTTLDTVDSYFGMRKITMNVVNGYHRFLLNNKDTFMMGPLDQGFWPDGIYVAPTDEALKYDIEQEKALGYNMVRKHIKVEPARWYYWADKLGIMVWQDMPSENSYTSNPAPLEKEQYEVELRRMVENHWNSPSIIMWCVFNEDQGQFEPARLVEVVRSLDSSRLINQGSGGPYANAGDIYDLHSYPAPGCPNSTTQARVCGEYGGVGLRVPNHQWNANGSLAYIMVGTPEELTGLYETYANSMIAFKSNKGLCAGVYTEITDVEVEINGFMTYDRLMKVDANKIKAINEKIINKLVTFTEVLPVSKNQKQTWKYTTATPASNWYSSNFDDAPWSSGQGGFGTSGTPGISIGTTWNTNDIWMRMTFNPGTLTPEDISRLSFNIFHDESCEIYINGVLAGSATGYSTDYVELEMNQAGKAAIKSNENNVIAVHCHQTTGGQGIDVGIAKVTDSNPKGTDATLRDLKIGGTTITGFDAATTIYNVELPVGTTTAPEVAAEVNATGKATAAVTQAQGVSGSATVVVTAEDGVTTKTYTINFTINAEDAYKAQLAAATTAVEKAEASKLQADVDSARALVDALRDADKASLGSRLDKVQSYIDYQAQLSAATEAVEKAEASNLQEDVDMARSLVNLLEQQDKAALNARLDKVQSYIDATAYKELQEAAKAAVAKAEASKLQPDVDSARGLVNELKDNDPIKAGLTSRLDAVQNYIDSLKISTVSIKPNCVQYSDTIDITARLVAGGKPVDRKTITFEVDGAIVGTAVTSKDGKATIKNIKITLKAGTYPVSVYYKQGNLKVAESKYTLKVIPEKAKVQYNGKTLAKASEQTKLSAKVTQDRDNSNGDLSLVKVKFDVYTLESKGKFVQVGSYTAECNTSGEASVSQKLGKGMYFIKTSIIGDGYFVAATDFSVLVVR